MDTKTKWNNKYKERLKQTEQPAPNERLEQLSPYLKGELAIDIACGLGANSFYLAKHGYNVQAYDISEVALQHVQIEAVKNKLSIDTHLYDLSDLNRIEITPQSIDLVVQTYYLDRSLYPFVKKIMNENGYFFMETYYDDPYNQENVAKQYKLRPKELLNEFWDWHVLYYEENEKEGRQTIFARKK